MPLKDRNISRAPQRKNTSGAKSANPFLTDPKKWAVTIAQMIRAVQRIEQMMAATNDTKKNHFTLLPPSDYCPSRSAFGFVTSSCYACFRKCAQNSRGGHGPLVFQSVSS